MSRSSSRRGGGGGQGEGDVNIQQRPLAGSSHLHMRTTEEMEMGQEEGLPAVRLSGLLRRNPRGVVKCLETEGWAQCLPLGLRDLWKLLEPCPCLHTERHKPALCD